MHCVVEINPPLSSHRDHCSDSQLVFFINFLPMCGKIMKRKKELELMKFRNVSYKKFDAVAAHQSENVLIKFLIRKSMAFLDYNFFYICEHVTVQMELMCSCC